MNDSEQKVLQRHLAQFIINDVFNLPMEEDVLEIKSPTLWRMKGRDLAEAEIVMLRAQAERLLESELWKVLHNAMYAEAQNRGMTLSKTESDLIASKILVYVVDMLESILKKMSTR